MMTCSEMKKDLMELFMESRSLPAAAQEHVATCAGCTNEMVEMQRTWELLDAWAAPEPSAFFDAKLYARLRTEQSLAPASFLERARAWLLYSSNLHMRPLAAGALATVLVIGGGTAALIDHQKAPMAESSSSATVRDLQSYDGNAQLYQQLNALDADEDASGSSN